MPILMTHMVLEDGTRAYFRNDQRRSGMCKDRKCDIPSGAEQWHCGKCHRDLEPQDCPRADVATGVVGTCIYCYNPGGPTGAAHYRAVMAQRAADRAQDDEDNDDDDNEEEGDDDNEDDEDGEEENEEEEDDEDDEEEEAVVVNENEDDDEDESEEDDDDTSGNYTA